ncbi:MAG: outer membrane protein assembly factor BamA [Gammaproteobacteria bacterium CG11_big_fil_rev_8_21_14_0_20_46_22]|nr:MAG: outer membrane protein assembly factor BamA [Gammaproteobacteria bacterium CG12_big_fil_rev_8_21_14_0_65_46_12]PIR11368.1 MAG: outer membrane protein assembly factor BamA [Gammaproteobacteria bacterium CG11_big_fil_rev_8_21_14_0_20_46_22]
MKRLFTHSLSLVLLVVLTSHASAFVIKRIRFEGLGRISTATAMSHMPVKVGEDLTPEKSNEVIKDLYKTGFFKNVQLLEDSGTLIVKVEVLPVVSKITISGNKVIKTKELLQVLQKMNIAEGYEYNRTSLKQIRSALLSQYYSHGKYNARVSVTHHSLSHDRMAINIAISEGVVAKIKQIRVIGHQAFTEHDVLSQFKLSTPGLFSWFTHDDEYSSEKLQADLEALKNFYLNKGYLKMSIDSSQVSLSPDRKQVYIVVKITEGPQYHFSGFKLAGRLILPRQQLRALVPIHDGDVYSKDAIVSAEKAIGFAIGDKGYARSEIVPKDAVDEKTHRVFITFNINPGRRVYVRRITFSGAPHTNDNAFRRALTQMEGEEASSTKLANSKQQLQLLPFVQGVDEQVKPVPGRRNEEDINYNMQTYPGGEIQAGVGYSDLDGFLVNASLSQSNFYGTGNQFSVSAQRSQSTLSGSLNYYNPYYTPWGVGRGFNLYASRFDADKQNISDYATNNYGFGMNYSIPMSLHNSIQAGVGLDYLHLIISGSAAPVMTQFKDQHGDTFLQFLFNTGWTFNNLNRSVFPTKGIYSNLGLTLSAPASKRGLEYYTGDYTFRFYQPLFASLVFMTREEVGYGGGYGAYQRLPFFKNFYAGGMGTVAGYEGNTLGPQDANGNALGGNTLATARAGIIFPNPISKSLRTMAFVDGGNVFDTKSTAQEKADNPDRNGLRYSAGLEVDWLTPFTGVLKFSFAKAINPARQDNKNIFQFNIGTSF